MATIDVGDTDSATFSYTATNREFTTTESFAATDVAGVSLSRSGGRSIADLFRATETERVIVVGVDPLLARPLYALIETPPLTATIIDYLEQIEDSDWRESGIDIDI